MKVFMKRLFAEVEDILEPACECGSESGHGEPCEYEMLGDCWSDCVGESGSESVFACENVHVVADCYIPH